LGSIRKGLSLRIQNAVTPAILAALGHSTSARLASTAD
jgi:hypothetical protein